MEYGPRGRDLAIINTEGLPSPAAARPSVFRRTGNRVNTGAGWLADRIQDAAGWLANLVRYGPNRIARVVSTLVVAIVTLLEFGPSVVRTVRRDRASTRPFVAACTRRGRTRSMQMLLAIADLIGAPEIYAFVWRGLTHVTPLTGPGDRGGFRRCSARTRCATRTSASRRVGC